MRGRTALAAALCVAVLLLGAPPAAAGQYVDKAVSTLRGDHVYLDPDARAVPAAAAGRLRDRIRGAGTPVFIAILPERARGEGSGGEPATSVAAMIADGVGEAGAYGVLVGNQFRAGDLGETLPRNQAARLATEAVNAHPTDPEAALADWVDRVGAAARSNGSGSRSGGAGSVLAAIVVVGLLLAGGALLLRARRRRRDEEERQFAQVRSVAQEDLLALGEDIQALDLDTRMPGTDPDAAGHYARAVDAYQRAAAAFDRARRPRDLAPVSGALEEGRYEMTATRAVLEGREPPERRPPCFFDPRHGPSVEDVEWAPPGGVPRVVPACADDGQRLRDGEDPRARQVLVGGAPTPYWNAPGYYGPWFGGFYGGFGGMGGLLTGFLLGEALGGWGGAGGTRRSGSSPRSARSPRRTCWPSARTSRP
ncbi:MAG TPA: hypothetical protein VFD04_04185, partial [Actinomycetes bacterium]|nr:hypothetical protein [Actinomycetes bacterium]